MPGRFSLTTTTRWTVSARGGSVVAGKLTLSRIAPVCRKSDLCQKQNIHDTFNMVDGERI
jgi:hypothetical protein